MKRYIFAAIGYLTTGVGVYHTFFGGFTFYGLLILMFGFFGIIASEAYYKKLKTD
ncbi:hypothetical protein [Bacillus sinesaloumensis]|uniref:hypothetical protein n=1 Tax=Litchfieldia sinesaloumensis TaxID=1926280 RepID=UPI0013563A67|nr:hypothetical protein [Bacillus sinesaloumensis]